MAAEIRELELNTLVVGTGAAGYAAAVRLHRLGERSLAVAAEHTRAGTSRNTGSDKQTYYKLSLCGGEPDSIRAMAKDLFGANVWTGIWHCARRLCQQNAFTIWRSWGFPFRTTATGNTSVIRPIMTAGEEPPAQGPIPPG